MITKYELDHIDERADKEILELISCAIAKRQLERKRVTKELRTRQEQCILRYMSHFPDDYCLSIDICYERGSNGKYRPGGTIKCRATAESRSAYEDTFD